jgi:hypothetical protein
MIFGRYQFPQSFIESLIFAMIRIFTAPEDTEYESLCPLEFVDSQHSKGAQNVAKANESPIQINLRAPKSTAEGASDHAQEHNRPSNLYSATARVTYESGNQIIQKNIIQSIQRTTLTPSANLAWVVDSSSHTMATSALVRTTWNGGPSRHIKRSASAFHPSARPLTVKKGRSC